MSQDVVEKLLFALGGSAAGMAATIFALARDGAFVRGQLSEVLRRMDAFQRVAEHVAILDKALLKTGIDVSHAHDKIRKMERSYQNGPADERR